MLRNQSTLRFYSVPSIKAVNVYENEQSIKDEPCNGEFSATYENVDKSVLLLSIKITDNKVKELNEMEIVYSMNKESAKVLRDYINSFIGLQE
jgi:hypothetical protein